MTVTFVLSAVILILAVFFIFLFIGFVVSGMNQRAKDNSNEIIKLDRSNKWTIL